MPNRSTKHRLLGSQRVQQHCRQTMYQQSNTRHCQMHFIVPHAAWHTHTHTIHVYASQLLPFGKSMATNLCMPHIMDFLRRANWVCFSWDTADSPGQLNKMFIRFLASLFPLRVFLCLTMPIWPCFFLASAVLLPCWKRNTPIQLRPPSNWWFGLEVRGGFPSSGLKSSKGYTVTPIASRHHNSVENDEDSHKGLHVPHFEERLGCKRNTLGESKKDREFAFRQKQHTHTHTQTTWFKPLPAMRLPRRWLSEQPY